MICVYDIGNESFTANGDAVLHPISCVATEDAGGSYEIALTEPVKDGGGWTHLACGAIVKVPVPVPAIQDAYVGEEVDVYKTTSSCKVRSGKSEPTAITYSAWSQYNTYSVGSRCTYSSQNYECIYWDSDDIHRGDTPAANTAWWKKIANSTSGSPVLVTLATNTEVYFVDDEGDGWYKISTKNGITGYAKSSQLTFVRHEEVEPVTPREVEDQLFRIYKVVINNDQRTVTVNARHVSYDLSGVLLGDCNISLAVPTSAIMRIQDAFMIPYRGQIATNMTGDENGTYTGDLSGKNGTAAFLDPDKGMIPYFRGKLIRDNWDLYLMKNDITDRGYRVTYGTNMRGVTWTRNSDNMINRVVPVARNQSGDDLILPETWVDSPEISNWPVIRMERLKVEGQIGKDDGTGTDTRWTEETLYQQMRTRAGERFSVDHVDAVNVEIQVNFAMLGDSEEYRQYRELEKVYLYDLVRVTDPHIGLNLQLQVSQTQFDCVAKRYIGIKVGNVFDYGGRSVFGYNIGNGAIDYEKISIEAVRKIQSN